MRNGKLRDQLVKYENMKRIAEMMKSVMAPKKKKKKVLISRKQFGSTNTMLLQRWALRDEHENENEAQ
jgi:hypothetical protein